MKQIDLAEILAFEQRYRNTFMNSISGFKSLQMVASANKHGVTNIALFNSIFHVGANPPHIGMVLRPDGAEHETLANILETGVYTLNNVVSKYYKAAHQTSARYPAGESEFKHCGFTEEYIPNFKAPFVKESNIKLGLALKEVIPVAINNTKIVIGEVQHILLDEELVSVDGYIDLAKAQSTTVAGLDAYYSTTLLGRLKYAKADNIKS
jgi:flavin reductase (DIM6/NTAB) family NADH-FMN oxidoreductase RutF